MLLILLLQLADLLIGIISYINRGLTGSPAKNALIERMQQRSGYSLTKTNLYLENKGLESIDPLNIILYNFEKIGTKINHFYRDYFQEKTFKI